MLNRNHSSDEASEFQLLKEQATFFRWILGFLVLSFVGITIGLGCEWFKLSPWALCPFGVLIGTFAYYNFRLAYGPKPPPISKEELEFLAKQNQKLTAGP